MALCTQVRVVMNSPLSHPWYGLRQAIADRIKTNLADQAGTMDNSAEYLEAASGNMVNRADVGIGAFVWVESYPCVKPMMQTATLFCRAYATNQVDRETELGQKRYDRIWYTHLRQQTIEMIAKMADAPLGY